MKPGVYFDLPAADYFEAPGVSNSMLQHLTPPARLPAYLAEPEEPTEEMILGTLAHSMILEPEKPLPGIVVPPETYPAPPDCSAVKQKKAQPGDPLTWHWSAKYCQRWLAEAKADGLIVLSQDRLETLKGVVRSIAEHPLVQKVISLSRTEVAVFADWPVDVGSKSVLRKCRIDFVPRSGNIIGDIKTVQDASREAFEKKLLDDGWAEQAVGNLDLWNAHHPDDERELFCFILVEKKAPFLVATYVVEPSSMQIARERVRGLLNIYELCRESDQWPGYEEQWVSAGYPAWLLRKEFAT